MRLSGGLLLRGGLLGSEQQHRHRRVAQYLGRQKNLYTGAEYELTRAHLDGWRDLWVEKVDPERYLLLLETGDEVLAGRFRSFIYPKRSKGQRVPANGIPTDP